MAVSCFAVRLGHTDNIKGKYNKTDVIPWNNRSR